MDEGSFPFRVAGLQRNAVGLCGRACPHQRRIPAAFPILSAEGPGVPIAVVQLYTKMLMRSAGAIPESPSDHARQYRCYDARHACGQRAHLRGRKSLYAARFPATDRAGSDLRSAYRHAEVCTTPTTCGPPADYPASPLGTIASIAPRLRLAGSVYTNRPAGLIGWPMARRAGSPRLPLSRWGKYPPGVPDPHCVSYKYAGRKRLRPEEGCIRRFSLIR
jgi:hypothetical protein